MSATSGLSRGQIAQSDAEHVLPLHRRVAHEAIARGDVLANGVRERAVAGPVGQIADAHAAARDLVLVGRSDAARRRADLALAAARLGQQLDLAVIRQDEMRLVADEKPARPVDAERRQLVELREERRRIDDDAVADDAGDASDAGCRTESGAGRTSCR